MHDPVCEVSYAQRCHMGHEVQSLVTIGFYDVHFQTTF